MMSGSNMREARSHVHVSIFLTNISGCFLCNLANNIPDASRFEVTYCFSGEKKLHVMDASRRE
jgi:hypothetical protein